MLHGFKQPSKVSFIVGGQWGSEGKGAAAAFVAAYLGRAGQHFDVVTTNAGAQAGHTSIHNGVKRIHRHLPTYPSIVAADGGPSITSFLNAGSIIDPEVLEQELSHWPRHCPVLIHPNASIITDECREAELRPDSGQTAIASTRKGVGEALSRKVLRTGKLAKDHPAFKDLIYDLKLNSGLQAGSSVLAEVPQGIGLGLNSRFYPYCTSRECTPMQAMSDARIALEFAGPTMLVLRTFPIRVGNIVDGDQTLGTSGDFYLDQQETTWEAVGVPPEMTTVTGRVRRVFTFSAEQAREAVELVRPQFIYLTFCDYSFDHQVYNTITSMHRVLGRKIDLIQQYGPSTTDVATY